MTISDLCAPALAATRHRPRYDRRAAPLPGSKLATTRHWHVTTLAQELRVQDATENDLYTAMDWLLEHQKAIEQNWPRST